MVEQKAKRDESLKAIKDEGWLAFINKHTSRERMQPLDTAVRRGYK